MSFHPRIPSWDILRKDTRLPLLVIAAVGFFIVYSLWQLTTLITLHHESLAMPLSHTPIKIQTPHSSTQPHLFGNYRQGLADLPPTPLPLSLEGIILSVDASSTSRALIASPGLPVKIYRIGDAAPGGVVIQQIFRDHVILNDKGRLEHLDLPIPKITGTITEAH